jgi:hypothetical protein
VNFGTEAYSPALLTKVKKDTAFLRNMTEGCVKLSPAVATARAENISGETFRVNAHANWFLGINFTTNESKVFGIIGINLVKIAIEVPKISGHRDNLLTRDKPFGASSIFNELGDRAGFQPMFFLVFAEVANSPHCPIFVHNFTNYTSRWEPG